MVPAPAPSGQTAAEVAAPLRTRRFRSHTACAGASSRGALGGRARPGLLGGGGGGPHPRTRADAFARRNRARRLLPGPARPSGGFPSDLERAGLEHPPLPLPSGRNPAAHGATPSPCLGLAPRRRAPEPRARQQPPPPRMSLKVAFWLSDVSVPGRGNMLIVPGSHERNTLPRPDHPELGFEPPAGAEPVLASAGDALVFDRRLWHSRSDNLSEYTRRVVFLAYSFRWVRPGTSSASTRPASASGGYRQCAGSCSASPASRHHQWGLQPGAVPLQAELDRQGLLNP